MSELRDRLEATGGAWDAGAAPTTCCAPRMRDVPTHADATVPDDDVDDDDLPIIDDDDSRSSRPTPRDAAAAASARWSRPFGIAALVGRRHARRHRDVRQRWRRLARGRRAPARRCGHAQGSARRGRRARAVRGALDARDASATLTHRAADLKIVDRREPAARRCRPLGRQPAALHRDAGRRLRQGHDHRRRALGGRAPGGRCRSCSRMRCATWPTAATRAARSISRSSPPTRDLPTFVVAVRHDGGWYVSPAYTALEYAREIDDGARGRLRFREDGADSAPTRPSSR